MTTAVGPAELRGMCNDGGELALIDVREELIYSQGHLLLARSTPLSRLELKFAQLVPRRATRIVLCDDGDGLAERAAKVLARNGYSDLRILAGGVTAWAKAGFELFTGVNVPSKAFGEFIEHEQATPSIAAEELATLLRGRAPISSSSTAGHSMNMRGSLFRARPMCPAPSSCCARAISRPLQTHWWWSIAPAAPAASSARNR